MSRWNPNACACESHRHRGSGAIGTPTSRRSALTRLLGEMELAVVIVEVVAIVIVVVAVAAPVVVVQQQIWGNAQLWLSLVSQ